MKRIDYILDFCKELGKRMIASGANIERVDLCLEKICHAYGLHDVTCANLNTRISISAKDEEKNYAHRQTDVPPQVLNLSKLKKLNRLSFKVVEETPDVTTLYDLLHSVKTKEFPWPIQLLGFIIAMAGLGRIFLAGWQELLVIELNTIILFGLSKLFTKIKLNKIITNFASMFICTSIGILMTNLGFINNFFAVLITNAFFLIPGIAMINCARNLLCGSELNGIIELLKVALEVCTIVAGLAAAYALFESYIGTAKIEDYIQMTKDYMDPNSADFFIKNVELAILTLLASVGFSIVFNIHLKDLPFAALGGFLIRIFYILFKFAIPQYKFVYTMLAAFFTALYSEALAISRKEPSTLFLYPSIIPLIPGDLFFYAALGILWSDSSLFGTYAPDLLLCLVGISVGFVVCSTFVHYIRKFKFKRKLSSEENDL